MLQVQITKDETKLAKQIEALEQTLEQDNLTEADREIFTETLKILKEEYAKEEETNEMRTITNLTNNGLSLEHVQANEKYFSKADMRLLRTCENLDARMHDLQVFTSLYKDWYAPKLIARSFVQYKDSIAEICELENEFRQLKIITPFNRLHVITLDELLKLMNLENGIKAEAKKFYDEFYKDMKDDYCFGKILFRFKQSKKKSKYVA